jgi:hypothetical protein
VRVQVNRAERATASFAVLSSRVAYSLDGVQVLNARGQLQRRFRAGDQVVLRVRWTVHNLIGQTYTRIATAYQTPVGRGWVTQETPTSELLTLNGATQYVHGFRPRSTVRVVVRLTLAGVQRQRAVVIQVH